MTDLATQQAALRALDAQLLALDRFSINALDDLLQADTDGDLVSLASVRSELARLLGPEPGEK